MEDAREPDRSESTLVVAISSRALFDLGESHALFEREGVDAFARYQIAREDELLADHDIVEPLFAAPLMSRIWPIAPGAAKCTRIASTGSQIGAHLRIWRGR